MKSIVILLLAATAGLTGWGWVMLATWQYAFVVGDGEPPGAVNALAVQTIGIACGWLLLGLTARLDARRLHSIATPFFAASWSLLLVNGIIRTFFLQHRMMWGAMLAHVQPAVIAGWAGMWFLARWHGSLRSPRWGWVPFAALGALVTGLFVLPDYASALGALLAGGIVMFLGGAKGVYVLSYIACVLCGMLWTMMQSPVRVLRLAALCMAEHRESCCRPIHRMALEAGGWTGAGLGRGEWVARRFPVTDGNWVSAHIGEELGLLGLLALLGLYLAVLIPGIIITARTTDPYGRGLGTAIVSMVGTSVLLNMACLWAPVYIKAPDLPLVSYGAPGLCLSLAAVGILVNLAHGNHAARRASAGFPLRDHEEPAAEGRNHAGTDQT